MVDLVAEGLKAVDPAGGGHDGAAGLGEVEAELAAEARGGSGHHHYLATEVVPWLEVVAVVVVVGATLATHFCLFWSYFG